MIREGNGRLLVSGPVTMENATALLQAGDKYLGKKQTLFDFSEVNEIDSASVSLMLEWSRRARAGGAEVRFVNLGEAVRSLTSLYGVENLILLDAE